MNHAVQAERVLREKIGDDLTQAITEKMFEARTAQSSVDSLRIATEILALVDEEIQKEAERQQPPPQGAGGVGGEVLHAPRPTRAVSRRTARA